MRVADEAFWVQQKNELTADDTGQAFLNFLEDWLTTAERAMDLSPDLPAQDAFRNSLNAVEQRQGRIACSYVGQMVVVAISHWVYGPDLADNLTSIERRLMEDVVLLKLSDLESQAAEAQESEDEVPPTPAGMATVSGVSLSQD